MFLKYFKWALLWALLIFILLLVPDHNPEYTSWLGEYYIDKIIHAGLFFIQSFFLLYGFIQISAFAKSKIVQSILAFFFTILYSGTLELLQSRVSEGRTTDLYDFIANVVGALSGVVFYSSALKLFERIVPPKFRI